MTLRAAIIGYGLAGSAFHAPLIDATPGMDVASIVTSNPERQRQARERYPEAAILTSPEELWRDPARFDVVIIATPNRTHAPLAEKALQAGYATVVDKPMATSVEEAERLIDLSRSTGSLLTVFQNRRWDTDFLTTQKLLASGLLGDIVRYEARYERYRLEVRTGSWKEQGDPAVAGGLLFDLGSHVIDQACLLFGEPRTVYAELYRRRPGTLVDDDTFLALEFPGGIAAHLWLSLVVRAPGPRVRVVGLAGTYEKRELDPQEELLRADQRAGGPGWGREPRDRWGTILADIKGVAIEGRIESVPGNYLQFYAGLAAALTDGGPPPVDPSDAVRTLRVIAVARSSAERSAVVSLAAGAGPD